MRNIERGHEKEDEFRSLMQKAIKYIVRHRDNAIWGGITIVAVVVGLIYISSKRDTVKPEAELMYTQAMSMVTMGRMQDGEQLFQQLSEKFPSTRPGTLALYYLGTISFYNGRHQEALTFFEKYLAKDRHDYLLGGSALYAAGCAAEGVKDLEKALGFYRRITSRKDSPFYFAGQLATGRIEGLLGNREQARQILQDLLKEENLPQDISSDAKFYIGYFN